MSTLSSTSSRLSASVLPISLVISLASCWRLPARAAQAFFTSSVLSCSGLAFQDGCAVRAAATAASISDGVDTRTRWMTAPVAGFVSTIWPCSIFTPWTIVSCARTAFAGGSSREQVGRSRSGGTDAYKRCGIGLGIEVCVLRRILLLLRSVADGLFWQLFFAQDSQTNTAKAGSTGTPSTRIGTHQ